MKTAAAGLSPACWPFVYWIAVALPLALWASPVPAVSGRHLAFLAAGLTLCLAIARFRGGRRRDGARLRLFLASGAVFAALHGRFHPNELAGVLALYLPLAVALALSPALDKRPAWRWQLALLAGLFGWVLARTGSRGGLLATALALAAVAAASGRRGRLLLAGAAVAALAVSGVLGGARVAELLVFEGSAQGLVPDALLRGRLAIWHRAAHAMADFPFTGLGLGAFGPAFDALYPRREPLAVEDAHDLYLQTALDLGLPGLAAFLAFVAVLVRRLTGALTVATPGSLRRAQLLGLLAGLGAHLLHGVADSVSPGSPGNLAWWLLCGVILAHTREPAVRRSRRRAARRRPALVLGALALALVAGAPWLVPRLRHNLAAVAAARVLVAENGSADAAAARLARAGLCRGHWLRGLLAAPGSAERRAQWTSLVECSPRFFVLLQETAGRDRHLAARAVESWGEDAEAHFWLARALAPAARPRAIGHYRRGLELRPSAARAWIELGDLLIDADPAGALAAYGEACRRGDPGANACIRAGIVAERLGDVEAAIRWYRRSRWGPSRERAAALEASE